MAHVEYFFILVCGWIALLCVDAHYRVGVAARWRRLCIVELLTLMFFLGWDSLGVHRGYWRTRPERVIGVWPLPGVPVEEFVLLAMITYAAVVLWRLITVVRPRVRAPAEAQR